MPKHVTISFAIYYILVKKQKRKKHLLPVCYEHPPSNHLKQLLGFLLPTLKIELIKAFTGFLEPLCKYSLRFLAVYSYICILMGVCFIKQQVYLLSVAPALLHVQLFCSSTLLFFFFLTWIKVRSLCSRARLLSLAPCPMDSHRCQRSLTATRSMMTQCQLHNTLQNFSCRARASGELILQN